MGDYHPESPARLSAILDRLIASGVLQHLDLYDAPLATPEQLQRVHEPRYVSWIFENAPTHGLLHLDPDTAMNPDSLNAALRAAGAVVCATDLVIGQKAANAFCRVRPPGHHALSNHAMGFCIFNNIAVGAAHAIAERGLARVAIMDFDVHHGNGTEQIFTRDPRVMLCSTFQHPFYPYQGADSGNEHIINVPLPAGTDGEGFRSAVNREWRPAIERFKPEMFFVSAGFDAHRDDPLAHLNLVEADYAWVTHEIARWAQRYAQGRIVSALEGGYNLDALGRSVTEHIRVLCTSE
jgi:acetoin utilization deacetylase AcuC-like enzyme